MRSAAPVVSAAEKSQGDGRARLRHAIPILAHVAGLLLHKLVRNDGVFETMAPTGSTKIAKPAVPEIAEPDATT